MKKMNNKGFALVETLIVSVFVMGIFTVMFTNFLPMMGEYEKREKYDDIDSVYNTYIIGREIKVNSNSIDLNIPILIEDGSNNNFCSSSSKNSQSCNTNIQSFFKAMNIEKIIITKYEIDKSRLKKMISSDAGMCDYIDSLSNFTKNQNKLNGRIIVKYKHVVNNEG